MGKLLRNVKIEDLAVIRRWRNDSEINKYMFSQQRVKQSEHLAWFKESEENRLKRLSVFEEDGEIIGFVQLQRKTQDSGVYEWGFYRSPQAVKGTGAEMLKLVLNKVFLELKGEKIFAEVLGFNHASIRLHKKLGFSQEGLLRKQFFLNEKYHDVYCFGILQSEWLKLLEREG
jgi:UDP-4-amino-4,6-dideoxy-N-acetyl-beta-L-altrosamine N-acetyltransferase